MIFEDRIKPYLHTLAHTLIDKEIYGHLPSIANILTAFKSGQWHRLPDEEKVHWLKKLCQIVGGRDGLVDWFGYDNECLSNIMKLAQAQIKAIEQRQ